MTIHQAIVDDGIKNGVDINPPWIAEVRNAIKWWMHFICTKAIWLKDIWIQECLCARIMRWNLCIVKQSVEVRLVITRLKEIQQVVVLPILRVSVGNYVERVDG